MSDNRETASALPSFQSIDLGIVSTNEISSTEVENFLGSSPDEVELLEEEEETPKPKVKKQEVPKKKESPEEEVSVEKPLEADVLGNEDEEEEEEETLKENSKEKAEDEPEEENVFSSLTKELKQLGVFSEIEDEPEVKDGNQFKERFSTEVQNRVESSIGNFIGKFGDDYQEAFQAIYIDGVDPREYFQQSYVIENLEEYDLSIVDNQKQIIKQYYGSIGWAQDKIAAKIQKLEDSGDLEEDATGYHQVLLQKEKTQLEEKKKVKAQEQFQKQQNEQQYQASVVKILNEKIQKKEFDSIPVDQKFAQDVNNYITQYKYRNANGELLTDFDLEILNLKRPDNYEKKVKIAMLLRMMETDPTLSKLTKKAISKEKDEAFSAFTRQKKTAKKQGEETYSSWGITK